MAQQPATATVTVTAQQTQTPGGINVHLTMPDASTINIANARRVEEQGNRLRIYDASDKLIATFARWSYWSLPNIGMTEKKA